MNVKIWPRSIEDKTGHICMPAVKNLHKIDTPENIQKKHPDWKTEEIALAVEKAIEALDMQIPKEVKIEDYCPTNCPTCDVNLCELLEDGYYNYWTYLERCPECGRAIKWEESY